MLLDWACLEYHPVCSPWSFPLELRIWFLQTALFPCSLHLPIAKYVSISHCTFPLNNSHLAHVYQHDYRVSVAQVGGTEKYWFPKIHPVIITAVQESKSLLLSYKLNTLFMAPQWLYYCGLRKRNWRGRHLRATSCDWISYVSLYCSEKGKSKKRSCERITRILTSHFSLLGVNTDSEISAV